MVNLKIVHAPGKYQDKTAYTDTLEYCMKPSKTPSGLIGGRNIDTDYAVQEMETVSQTFGKVTGNKLRHFILSFSPEENMTADEVAHIADQVAGHYSDRYQIVYAVHEDTNCPHAHFAMNHVSFRDGRHYYGTKQDYYDFQEHIKEVLRPYGKKLEVVD